MTKTQYQMERRIKWMCKEINEMNKEFQESNEEETRTFLTKEITWYLSKLRELKWCSGINYDKLIK